MDWNDIIVTVAFSVGMILFLVIAARRGEKMLAEQAARVKNSRPGQATILSYEEGVFGGRDSKGRFAGVRFGLEVTLPGQPPYQATTFWKVYPMAVPQLQVGKVVAVKVDATDPQIIYPDMPSVEYNSSAAQWQQQQEKGNG
jgi:hypothetical protein